MERNCVNRPSSQGGRIGQLCNKQAEFILANTGYLCEVCLLRLIRLANEKVLQSEFRLTEDKTRLQRLLNAKELG